MRKLIWTALVVGGAAWFIGTDAISSRVAQLRAEARNAVAAEVPLKNQLEEARRQVDAYAESIIRGEVAAEGLADRIRETEREVRTLATRVGNEREALASLRATMGGDEHVIATSVPLRPEVRTSQDGTLRRVRAFQTASVRLERRAQDLQRLKAEHASTLSALEQARDEQSRLGEEVRLLSAELESLEARKAAARTREGVLAEGLDASGWSAARERIDAIRASLREQSKLLAYYEVERTELVDEPLATLPVSAQDPAQAIDEVLAAWPAR
ncbi:MAG: hypothetical protein H6826_03675 [Planctomycetes bacterium]|nr:hypothetical protein [Planctomycetota bacterium]MCB9900431.1 hypothetical protein [Planctomycetota bacterium]